MTSWWCAHAWVGDQVQNHVRVVAAAGVIQSVTCGVPAEPTDVVLPGVVFPGFANAHSHAFHRALRGRTHGDGGTFWTWRDVMYQVASRLTPESYYRLARAAYAEMVLAGVTCVGEFHYVHHQPDGTSYPDPLAMQTALRQAATDAGLRITMLDTCYLTGGLTAAGHTPLNAGQARFGHSDATEWAMRAQRAVPDRRPTPGGCVNGAAIHSVRAVPREQLATVAAALPDGPVHVHVSEQPAENTACTDYYGKTPVELLADAGVIGDRFTYVHATHLTDTDITHMGSTTTCACFCPTTERDLADGIGPARALWDAGATLALGSDQHAVVDMFEDARAVEMHERLVTNERGRFTPAELVHLATVAGHKSLGWPDAGRIAAGAPADLVAVDTSSVRTAGSLPAQLCYAATAADVTDVICGGEPVVTARQHQLGDVGELLSAAIAELTE